jgi:prepilin-type N-terminal cleavage/methylation domain-containing protein
MQRTTEFIEAACLYTSKIQAANLPPLHRRQASRGMTLVELLVVIVIVAMLMSLATVGLIKARNVINMRGTQMEINNLAAAMTSFKEQHGNYPPCMHARFVSAYGTAYLSTTTPVQNRNQYLFTHLSTWGRLFMSSYSKYSPAGNTSNITAESIIYTGNASGTSGTVSYTRWNQAIIQQYTYQTHSSSYQPNGGTARLSMDTLDAAEALVFWLGGMPTPYNASGAPAGYITGSKLCGFNKRPNDPFYLDLDYNGVVMTGDKFMINRIPSLFNFDEDRLVDYDGDGWWEYVPTKPDPSDPHNPTNPNNSPPYVYFDAALYTKWISPTVPSSPPMSVYPPVSGTPPGGGNTAGSISINNTMAMQWGTVMPYCSRPMVSGVPSTFTTATSFSWFNPNSFQIIAPGADFMYSAFITAGGGLTARVVTNNENGLPTYTSSVQLAATLSTGEVAQPEKDNLTNFSETQLGDLAEKLDGGL